MKHSKNISSTKKQKIAQNSIKKQHENRIQKFLFGEKIRPLNYIF